MTKFEEIQALVEKNKKISKDKISNSQDDPLEVPGITDSSKWGNPHIGFASEETHPDLLQQLQNPKHTSHRVNQRLVYYVLRTWNLLFYSKFMKILIFKLIRLEVPKGNVQRFLLKLVKVS